MAKSAKHKKLRRQEKAKVQLTGVKRLAKAQNVVEPMLRSKKILVREQLKQLPEGEISTQRKQNLQDVLGALNHHNTNIKKEALCGLQELVTSRSNVLAFNLDRILEKIASLTSDPEESIRKENMKLAEIIFAQVSENQVQPFWNLLLTHLKCTLTNLNPTIRYSCLSFIQLLVSYFPALVSGSKHIILPSILSLISSSNPQPLSSAKSQLSKHKTRLKVEISEKHSDIKERMRVLSLIGVCLDLQHKASISNNSMSVIPYKNFDSDTSLENKSTDHKIQRSMRNTSVPKRDNHHQKKSEFEPFLSLLYPWGYDLTSLEYLDPNSLVLNASSGSESIFSASSSLTTTSNKSQLQTPDKFWPLFIQSCLPILCETWVEVGPSVSKTQSTVDRKKSQQKSNSDSSVFEIRQGNDFGVRGVASLSRTAVEVLNCIVNVMAHLIQGGWCQENSSTDTLQCKENGSQKQCSNGTEDLIRLLRKRYGQDLAKYFFNCLPFTAVQDSQRRLITSLNLQLFYTAAQLRLVDVGTMKKLDDYVTRLIDRGTLDIEQTNLILNILCFLHLPETGKLSTNFIGHTLETGHNEIIYDFLKRILSPENINSEETAMMRSLQWDILSPKILASFKSLTQEMLTMLTFIALRKLADIKPVLIENLSRFQDFLKNQDSTDVWDQVLRLFYYCSSLDTFYSIGELVTIPHEVLETAEALKFM